MKKIPLSRVFINDEARDAVLRVLNSGSYILSKECEAFEEELADWPITLARNTQCFVRRGQRADFCSIARWD